MRATARCSRCRSHPATGAYTFTLLDQLDHGAGDDDDDDAALIAINLSSVLVATDADGDFIVPTPAASSSSRTTFRSQPRNDLAAQTVFEDLLRVGNPDTPANPAGASTVATGTLAGLVSFGADQPGTITLSPTTRCCREPDVDLRLLFTTSPATC